MYLAKISLIVVVIVLTWIPYVQRDHQALPAVPPDTLITMERRADFFGNGTNYKVIIHADGMVVFHKSWDPQAPYAKLPAPMKTKIAAEKVAQLVKAFEQINYFFLKDRYMAVEDGCPAEITDQSSVTTSFTINRKTKAVYHNYGCRLHPDSPIYPEALTDLELKIDEIAETKRWLRNK